MPSSLRKQILSRFFSRIEPRDHADIYVIRSLPQEIRATLNGLYSRSHLSMRETFWTRLQKGLEKTGKSLEDLHLSETTDEEILGQFLTEKAGSFLRTYAIDHGHNSLREGAVVQLAVEQVSQRVTRFIQQERRASFEESSTRYIPFSNEGHWRSPKVFEAGDKWRKLWDETISLGFNFYQTSIEALQQHIQTARPLEPNENAKAYKRAVRAEAFDSARYLLTPALFTKWGLVADARTISDICTRLLSHPLTEFQIVGARIREEACKELPTLLSHASENPYLEETRKQLTVLGQQTQKVNHPAPNPYSWEAEASVRLLDSPNQLDDRILASLAFTHSQKSFESLMKWSQSLDVQTKAHFFETLLGSRGKRDAMPDGVEGGGMLDFEILLDFGAFRDIARHRKGFLQQEELTTAHGYSLPPLFKEAGLARQFEEVMSNITERIHALAERFPEESRYLIPFAFLQKVRVQFDVRQMAYFCELRSAPEGHFSYRNIAIRMGKCLREVAPLFGRFVRITEDPVFLGRVEAEHQRDQRRESRKKKAKERGFEI
jgi:thymidylate synthase ThyX